MNNNLGGQTPPPMPGAVMPVRVNSGLVAPGVFRIQFLVGPCGFHIDLPVPSAQQVIDNVSATLDQLAKRVMLVPGDALPPPPPDGKIGGP